MARYVDGFVFVIKRKNLAAYKKMATAAGRIWRKHGAIAYLECQGDDLRPKGYGPGPKPADFPTMVKAKAGETVWFSFIIYKSKAHRDAVNRKVMKDPAMNSADWAKQPMPFDMRKMRYGGFKAVVDA